MSWSPHLEPRFLDIGQDDDNRVGAARDNSTDGTLSHIQGNKSSSLTSLLGTLVPVLVYVTVCILIFWSCRRRMARVYSPRSILSSFLPHERSSALPANTWFAWVKPFFQIKDTTVLHHTTLDAYLFLRYIKILTLITFVGLCLTWPTLLPLHARGGGGNSELDALTIGNVTRKPTYFAHVLVAYVYFGFILFTIYRECIFYINLRHAYLFSPAQANRLSSRTVLFLCMPRRYLDERRLRKVFGDGVKNVWIPRDTEAFEKLVKERDQTARRLERAETRLIKLADLRRRKQAEADPPPLPRTLDDSPGAEDPEKTAASASAPVAVPPPPSTLPDVNGALAAHYGVRASERPHHRPLANYFRRVDTIKWTRNRLKALNPSIRKMRRRLLAGEGRPLPAALVEFTTQTEAEAAFQVQSHHRPAHMSPRFIGVRPGEIVWSVLGMGWAERIVRRFAIFALISGGIIFWSIPAAVVGVVSNIKFLAEEIPLMSWIVKLPKPILGVLQGFLPALALSLLMSLVPWMLRGCARAAGVPSLSMVELFVQNAYFAFQVVQVFLITTITSAASGALMSVIKDPLSAKDLLSQNLPKASNFYIAYILIQCMAAGASGLVHVIEVVRHQVMAKRLESPRGRFKIWHRTRVVHWGGIFPVFTNMGVIAISYSFIAPLILAFATAGLYVIYLVYRYNLLYIFSTDIDTRGLVYPRALMQLLVGVYLSEICMIGLFALRSAFVPMALMVLFLIASSLIHLSLSDNITPLLYNLPRTLPLESEELAHGGMDFEIGQDDAIPSGTPGAGPSLETGTTLRGEDPFDALVEEEEGNKRGEEGEHGPAGARALEGADAAMDTILQTSKSALKRKLRVQLESLGLAPVFALVDHWIRPDRNIEPNFVLRWLHPGRFEDFSRLQRDILQRPTEEGKKPEDDAQEDGSTRASADVEAKDIPEDPTEDYPPDYPARAYWPPAMASEMETLWIPRDEGGVSTQEIEHCRRAGVVVSDEGAWLEEGRVMADLDKAPFWEPKILY